MSSPGHPDAATLICTQCGEVLTTEHIDKYKLLLDPTTVLRPFSSVNQLVEADINVGSSADDVTLRGREFSLDLQLDHSDLPHDLRSLLREVGVKFNGLDLTGTTYDGPETHLFNADSILEQVLGQSPSLQEFLDVAGPPPLEPIQAGGNSLNDAPSTRASESITQPIEASTDIPGFLPNTGGDAFASHTDVITPSASDYGSRECIPDLADVPPAPERPSRRRMTYDSKTSRRRRDAQDSRSGSTAVDFAQLLTNNIFSEKPEYKEALDGLTGLAPLCHTCFQRAVGTIGLAIAASKWRLNEMEEELTRLNDPGTRDALHTQVREQLAELSQCSDEPESRRLLADFLENKVDSDTLLSYLEQHHTELVGQLDEARAMLSDLTNQEGPIKRDERLTDGQERTAWTGLSMAALRDLDAVIERRNLDAAARITGAHIAMLSTATVFLDAFVLELLDGVPAINGNRLGILPVSESGEHLVSEIAAPQQVPWGEISSALGDIVLLTKTLMYKARCPPCGWELLPCAHRSSVVFSYSNERNSLAIDVSPFEAVLSKSAPRFNIAVTGLVDCIYQLVRFIGASKFASPVVFEPHFTGFQDQPCDIQSYLRLIQSTYNGSREQFSILKQKTPPFMSINGQPLLLLTAAEDSVTEWTVSWRALWPLLRELLSKTVGD